ncbi:hypothetical protein TREMEDRAFT_20176, partial [Tremella mesenterica DSM 1558]
MAQGAHKLSSKANSGGRKDTGKMRKGKRVIAPKNKQRVQEAAQKRQLSAKINDSIEKQMVKAASGGKLTIMRGVGEVE